MHKSTHVIPVSEHETDLNALVAQAKAAKTPEEVIRCYRKAQVWEKAVEAIKTALKGKLSMLIPAGADAKPYNLPDMPGGRLLARRIEQDRRKIDPDLLTALLVKKNAPSEAFRQVAREDYAAVMVNDGRITPDELEGCLTGKKVGYTSLTWEPEAAGVE